MKILVKRMFMVIVFVMILQLFLFTPSKAKASEQGFTGYIAISTKTELNNIRNNLAANYYLTKDIVFTKEDFAVGGSFYNNGKGWNPIGAGSNTYFTGVFDGNGHTISGLYSKVTSNNDTYMGLFAYNDGTIRNVGLVNSTFIVNTSGSDKILDVGGIAGHNSGTISKCYNTGSITVTGYYSHAFVGGIAGYNDRASITNCYNSGNVSAIGNDADAYAGGITGENKAGNVSNCYNTGTIFADAPDDETYACAGGILGEMYNNANMSNCYNTGYISATGYFPYTGGNAGYIDGATIFNCYNVGIVYAEGSSGGIVGGNSGIISKCYYLNIANSGAGYEYDAGTSNGVERVSLDNMKQKSSYSGFDFTHDWDLGVNTSYKFPTLKSVAHVEKANNVLDFAGGNGTANNPYKISTIANLNNVRKDLTAFYVLTSNIAFNSTDFSVGGKYYNKGKCWSPIAGNYEDFTGVFDGNGHTISGLNCNGNKDDDTAYVGLFGSNNGTIKNLGVINGKITSTSPNLYSVGGIAGANDGSINQCYYTGSISINSSDCTFVGGIVGYNGGYIDDCCNTGSISVKYTGDYSIFVGGIAGGNYFSSIYDCYNTGNVNLVASSSIDSFVGGIVGYNNGYYDEDTNTTEYSSIGYCYNIGTISGKNAGGIVGDNNKDGGKIYNCYYYNSIAKGVGTGPSAGTKALSFAQLKQQSSFAGFDFTLDWGISLSTPFLKNISNTNIRTVAVAFNSNGGSAVTGKFANYNTTITAPTNPTRLGYTFGGWYTAATGGKVITFPQKVTASMTVYAHWNVVNPSTPKSVKAVSTGYNSIKITWAAASNANQYKVYRGTSSTNITTLVGTVTGLSYTNNTGLTTNKTYYYKVVAVNTGTGKKSGYSAVVSAKPIPATVSLTSAVKASTTSVRVNYKAVSGASGYQIYYATSATGKYTLAGTSTTTTFTKKSLTKGKVYYFKVRAFRTVGKTKVYGNYSIIKSVRL